MVQISTLLGCPDDGLCIKSRRPQLPSGQSQNCVHVSNAPVIPELVMRHLVVSLPITASSVWVTFPGLVVRMREWWQFKFLPTTVMLTGDFMPYGKLTCVCQGDTPPTPPINWIHVASLSSNSAGNMVSGGGMVFRLKPYSDAEE